MRLINICFYCLKNQKRFLPNPVITNPLRRSFSTHKPLPTDILRRSRIKKSTNTQLDTNVSFKPFFYCLTKTSIKYLAMGDLYVNLLFEYYMYYQVKIFKMVCGLSALI